MESLPTKTYLTTLCHSKTAHSNDCPELASKSTQESTYRMPNTDSLQSRYHFAVDVVGSLTRHKVTLMDIIGIHKMKGKRYRKNMST